MQRRGFMLGMAVMGFGGIGLAGCSTPPAGDPPRISFDYLTPYRLGVRDYRIVDKYTPPNSAPNVEHLLDQPSWTVIDRWARRRIQPVGGSGQAVLSILDAQIVEDVRTVDSNYGPFSSTKEQYHYNARFKVRLDVDAPAWRMRGHIEATGQGMLELPERSTLSQQDVALVTLVERTMNDLNRAFEREMEQNFRSLMS